MSQFHQYHPVKHIPPITQKDFESFVAGVYEQERERGDSANDLSSLLASEILSCYARHDRPILNVEELLLLKKIETNGANNKSNQDWVKKVYRDNEIHKLFWTHKK